MKTLTKNEFKELSIILFTILSIVFGILALAIEWNLSWWVCWSVFAVFVILSNVMLLSFYKKWTKVFKICLVALVCCGIFAIGYAICFYNGWLKYFESYQAIKDLILSAGIWGLVVFFLIQFAQVIVAPIPAMATILAGVAIYGPLVASLISTVAILVGSYVAFFLGRVFGRKIVVWIAGEAQTQKYSDILNKKGRYLLILMFIFPVFPDDLLCLIAGITSMSFRFFFFATLLTRPLGIFVTAYIGSGQLIPYSGWGLYVWPILIILLIVAFVICWKYQDQIEKMFMQKFIGWRNNIGNIKLKRKTRKFLKNTNNKGVCKSNLQLKHNSVDTCIKQSKFNAKSSKNKTKQKSIKKEKQKI